MKILFVKLYHKIDKLALFMYEMFIEILLKMTKTNNGKHIIINFYLDQVSYRFI